MSATNWCCLSPLDIHWWKLTNWLLVLEVTLCPLSNSWCRGGLCSGLIIAHRCKQHWFSSIYGWFSTESPSLQTLHRPHRLWTQGYYCLYCGNKRLGKKHNECWHMCGHYSSKQFSKYCSITSVQLTLSKQNESVLVTCADNHVQTYNSVKIAKSPPINAQYSSYQACIYSLKRSCTFFIRTWATWNSCSSSRKLYLLTWR